MNEDIQFEELLNDLRQLPQDIRVRYIKRLSREELEEVLALALQSNDKTAEQRGTTEDGTSVLGGASFMADRDKGKKRARASALSENLGDSEYLKRSHAMSPAKDEKRARVGGCVSQIAADSLFQVDEKPTPPDFDYENAHDAGMLFGSNSENKQTLPVHQAALAPAEHRLSFGGTILTRTWPSMKSLPMAFSVPQKDGSIALHDISLLQEDVGSELRRRFYAVLELPDRKKKFQMLISDDGPLATVKNFCIRDYVGGAANSSRKKSIYKHGGEFGKSADDLCMQRLLPCAHIVEHNGGCTVCLVPLPGHARDGKKWTDIGYWIQPGDFVR